MVSLEISSEIFFGRSEENIGSVYSGMENYDINAVFKSMFLVVPPSCL